MCLVETRNDALGITNHALCSKFTILGCLLYSQNNSTIGNLLSSVWSLNAAFVPFYCDHAARLVIINHYLLSALFFIVLQLP